MALPSFFRRYSEPEPVVDLSTPEAQAEHAAFLAASEPEEPRHSVDFHSRAQDEPPRHRPRRQYPCPVRIARASDGAEYAPYE
ncbi:hypothetical protein ACGFYQ_27430 [Streptomyces sp. NPDC048258]|uniref:hypothetical protein n=1 Tax=Streptomyces sp. NPDC048258 TaxID=3365527 RepID=UPI00371A1E17